MDGECQLYGRDVIRKETNGFVELSINSSHKGSKRFIVTMVDTAGYGHKMDAENWRKGVTDELERRMIERRQKELEVETLYVGEHQRLQRELKKIRDDRIHAILYFFDGHHCK